MSDALRVAIRKFEPFESAIVKQYADFQAATGCSLELEPVALDLNPLFETLFAEGGLKDGTWDIAFIVTDWLADAIADGALTDLTPYMETGPVDDYHDGPECLIYRTDWFADPGEQETFRAKFGYPLTVPTTWPQFEDVARHFTR